MSRDALHPAGMVEPGQLLGGEGFEELGPEGTPPGPGGGGAGAGFLVLGPGSAARLCWPSAVVALAEVSGVAQPAERVAVNH